MDKSPEPLPTAEVDAVVEEYLRRVDAGENIDQEAFLSEHASVAPALRSFFANEQLMRQWTAESPASKDTAQKEGIPTIPPSSVNAAALIGPAGALKLPVMMGRYRIDKELGRGAMGAVYLAHDSELDRPVALKIPKFSGEENPDLIARFLREARSAAVLAHPNICRVYDVSEHQGVRYIAMEYIEGKALSSFVAAKNVQPKQAATVIRKLAQGLAEAHQRGILHRDLKPDNILVNKNGEPVLTDFGLARETSKGNATATQDGVILGSPAYMPPEQAAGNLSDMGPTSDIYSLGVVLYELLTGDVPFRGSVVEVLASVLMKAPKTVRELKPDVDPGLAAICDKMMAKKPKDRYQSMQEVAQALGEWIKNPSAANAATSKLALAGEVKSVESKLRPGGQTINPTSTKLPTGKQTISPAKKVPERTPQQLKELGDLVEQLLARNDYAEAIQILEGIPDYQRTPQLRMLLGEALDLKGTVEKLERHLEKYLNQLDLPQLKKTIDKLLKIHPSHPRAKELKKAMGQYGKRGLVTILKEEGNYHGGGFALEPWKIGVAAASVLLLFAGMSYAVVVYIKGSMQEVAIEIDDPTATVKVDGQTVLISGQQTGNVKLTLGEHKYTVEKDGTVVKNPEVFTVAKDGQNKLVIDTKPKPGENLSASASGPAPEFTWALARSRQAKLANIKNKAESLNATAFNGMFTEIPPRLTEVPTKIFIGEDNIAAFDVVEDGFVILTCNYDNQGNSSGDWLDKRWTAEQFIAKGWKQLTEAEVGGRLYAAPHKRLQTFFVKFVHKGENFALSCNKSDPPYLIQFETPGDASNGNTPPLAVAPFDAAQAKAHQAAWAKHLGVPVEFTNSLGMKFRLIPPGEFLMGSAPGEPDAFPDESPQHKVRITKPFYLGVTEVTAKQWSDVMGSQPWSGQPFPPEGDDAGANYVNWNDATAFCEKLQSRDEGRKYRLPSEAEWEMACRAGTTTFYYFGDSAGDVQQYAWNAENSEQKGIKYPRRVGQKPPNPYGLLDITGNLWEWCADFYDGGYYKSSPAEDPQGPSEGPLRITRGGAWSTAPSGCRSARRDKDEATRPVHVVGFRLALPVEAAKPASTPLLAVAPFDSNQAKAHQEAWAKHLGVPVEFTNSIGMKFRLIPPGEYVRGSTPEQIKEWTDFYGDNPDGLDRARAEGPQHKVTLTKPFYLGMHEVTQKQYEQVVGVNPSAFHPKSQKEGLRAAVADKDTSNFPVDTVNWDEAAEFCAKLKDPNNPAAAYRLPTEAEWEFACRAGTATRYWTGDNSEEIAAAENFAHATRAVGELKPNPFGLYDMNGNVREWASDWWSLDEFQQFAAKPAVDPLGAKDGKVRVLRGGSWSIDPKLQGQSSLRTYDRPAGYNAGYGFRVVLPLEAVQASLAASQPGSAVAPFDAAQAKAHQESWAKRLDIPVEFTNSIGMKFRLIPPGEFTMGTPDSDPDGRASEKPQHKVRITRPYYLAQSELSQTQWKTIMGTTPWEGQQYVLDDPQAPASYFTYNEAEEFCRKLAAKENAALPYRIPTEAEWEYAARAGSESYFAFSNNIDDIYEYAWTDRQNEGRPHAVATRKPNPFGLHDMIGNIWEMCSDWHSADYSAHTAMDDPQGPSQGTQKVSRGGGWASRGSSYRAACRDPFDLTLRGDAIGLRVVLPVDAAKSAAQTSAAPQVDDEGSTVIAGHTASVVAVAVAPDSRTFYTVSDDTTFRGWDAASQQETINAAGKAPMFSTAVSSDGRFAAAGDIGGTIQVYELPSGKVIQTLEGHRQHVQGVTFNKDGQNLISAGVDGVFQLWNVKSGKKIREFPNDAGGTGVCVCLSRDGKEVFGAGSDGVIRCWTLSNGKLRAKWPAHNGTIYALALSPDGRLLAAAGHDHTVSVRRTNTGDETHRFQGHADRVMGVDFFPAGDKVVSAGGDRKLFVWDLEKSEAAASWPAHKTSPDGVRGVAVAASGEYLVSVGYDAKVRVWKWPREGKAEANAAAPPAAVAPFDATQAKAHQEAWAKHLGVPVEFTNSIGMKFRLIPPGEFLMGSPDSDPDGKADEKPQHKVRITKPFYLGTTEVTQSQWKTIMRSTPWKGKSSVLNNVEAPANWVDWTQSVAFCQELTAKDRMPQPYRLPTEAEWEFAARAGTMSRYGEGDAFDSVVASAWTPREGIQSPQIVATRSPNPFGLNDMIGNVWEWCADWYAADYGGSDEQTDPIGAATGSHHALRGGGFVSNESSYRFAARDPAPADNVSNGGGFRVVLPVEAVRGMKSAAR